MNSPQDAISKHPLTYSIIVKIGRKEKSLLEFILLGEKWKRDIQVSKKEGSTQW